MDTQKKKRIGILTIHAAHNYGSMLQAYALQQTVAAYADQAEVELIDYLPPCIMDGYSLDPRKNMRSPQMLAKYCLGLPQRVRRSRSFDTFAKDCFHLSGKRYTSNSQLLADAANWDVCILGSDQVWNPEIVSQDRAFWLDFARESFRASYASSFGTTNIPSDYLAQLTKALRDFDAIAVREPSARELLRDVGKPITVTCDPVFLLTAEQWAKLERKPKNVPDRYVLLYGVERNQRLEELARQTAEHYGLPLVDVGIRGNPIGYFGIHSPDYGPREFLYLVRHAAYMATNSFHGTAFGTIFGKKCISILHRSRGTRIRELAELAGRSRYILPEHASAAEMIACFEQEMPMQASGLHERIADSKLYLQNMLGRALVPAAGGDTNSIESVGHACTGCGACVHVCSRGSIRMKANAEGFFYPTVDQSSCINCGKCLKHCPALQQTQQHTARQWMGALSRQTDQVQRSASGGVFYTIGKWFIEQGGVVCGAVYGEDKTVVHTCADTLDGLKAMQDSKYVQSSTADCYGRIKQYLEEGRMVLFSGTPCQVAGLYACVGRHEGLWTMDLVCHGVPSPGFLKKHIEYLEKKHGKTAHQIRFRMKDPRNRTAFRLRLLQNDRCWYDAFYKNDVYYSLFMDGVTYRESCYECGYACDRRVGDLTMGDLGSFRDYPDFHPDRATSVVIVNSPRGQQMWEQVSHHFDCKEISHEKERAVNHQLSAPSPRPAVRDTIYSAIAQMPEEALQRRFCSRLSPRERVSLTVKKYLPLSVIAWIRKRS